MQKTANRKPTEIQSAAICRCVVPQDTIISTHYGHEVRLLTGETVYGVKSDTENKTYYVWWNTFFQCWDCTCAGCSHTECKHRRAVQEVITARKEADVIAQAVAVVASVEVASEWGECDLCTRKTKQPICGVCLGY